MWSVNTLLQTFPNNSLIEIYCNKTNLKKDLLASVLIEIIQHKKINDKTKLEILYNCLNKTADLTKLSSIEFKAIEDSKITNVKFTGLESKNIGLMQHLNLLSAIVQLGKIENIIYTNNSSDELATLLDIENIDKIGELVKNAISKPINQTSENKNVQDPLDITSLYTIIDNFLIWFNNLLMMNENKNCDYDGALKKIKEIIISINEYYVNNSNIISEIDMYTLVCLQNGLEFVRNVMSLCYLAFRKDDNTGSISSDSEKPNIIVSNMIINTLIYFGVLPYSEALHSYIVTNKNIDFWCENKMIDNIDMHMLFKINKNNFISIVPSYCNLIVGNLESECPTKKSIISAELLISYLQNNLNCLGNDIVNDFKSNDIIKKLGIAIKSANEKLAGLHEADNNSNNNTTKEKKDVKGHPISYRKNHEEESLYVSVKTLIIMIPLI